MELIQKDIILLLKSSIKEEKYELSDSFNIERIIGIAKKHAIVPLVFWGAINCGISQNDPVMMKFFQIYCQILRQHENQMIDIHKIYDEFEKHEIDYMPLKGCIMKGLYPKPEMRVMGDADILIKREQYPEIKKIMDSLKFEFIEEGDHDFSWRSDNLYLELHYMLIQKYNKKYEAYFGDGWKLACNNEGYQFCMSCEDEFIYLFIHYMKHYLGGGIGCRHVVDLWVYLRNHKDLKIEYIEKIMKNLSVYDFYKNTIKLIEVWFGEGEIDYPTEIMTEFIFKSGSWGSLETSMMARGVKAVQSEGSVRQGRIKVIKNAFFPPSSLLIHRYTILKRFPFVLPAVWIYRWFDILFNRKDGIEVCKNKIEAICDSDLTEYEKKLKIVGLDFTFHDQDFHNVN